MNTTVTRYPKLVPCLVLLILCSSALQAATPTGWLLAGDNPAGYDTGVDSQLVNNGHPSAYLKSKAADVRGFGTLMQMIRADKYAGKRLRLTAFVKSDGARDGAGLWMRVDKGSQSVAFDNMQDRPIKGTTGWKTYQVVLDVPTDATGISFGVLLSGPGEVWLNRVKLEVVGPDVPVTSKKAPSLPDEPANLNFENP